MCTHLTSILPVVYVGAMSMFDLYRAVALCGVHTLCAFMQPTWATNPALLPVEFARLLMCVLSRAAVTALLEAFTRACKVVVRLLFTASCRPSFKHTPSGNSTSSERDGCGNITGSTNCVSNLTPQCGSRNVFGLCQELAVKCTSSVQIVSHVLRVTSWACRLTCNFLSQVVTGLKSTK